MIIDNLALSVENARRAVALAVESVPSQRNCGCAFALADALVTALSDVPRETLRKLGPIIAGYVAAGEAGHGGE
jgi:hypothetical protein